MSRLGAIRWNWSPRDQNAALRERLAAYKAGSLLGVNICWPQPLQVRLLSGKLCGAGPRRVFGDCWTAGRQVQGKMVLTGLLTFSFF